MRKTFGGHMSGLHTILPTIVAELNQNIGFHARGARAYLILSAADPLAVDTVECLARTRWNHMKLVEMPWGALRFVEIQKVPARIGERCWRGSEDQMLRMVERIKAEKLPKENKFAPDVEL